MLTLILKFYKNLGATGSEPLRCDHLLLGDGHPNGNTRPLIHGYG